MTRKKDMTATELKEYNQQMKRKSRERQLIAKGEASFGTLVKSWDRHALELKKEDPERYQKYLQRHNQIELAETELQDVRFVCDRLGLSWDDVVDPLILLKDIKALSQFGELSYRQVESAMTYDWPLIPRIGDMAMYHPQKSFEGNEPAEAYKQYGFRLVLDSHSLPDAEKFAEQFRKETGVTSPQGSSCEQTTEGPGAE